MKQTFYTQRNFLFVFLFFNVTFLQAQDPAFSDNFANKVTNDSRPGWIKINAGNALNADAFMGILDEGLSLGSDFDFKQAKRINDQLRNAHYLYQTNYKGVVVENHDWILHEKDGTVFLAQGHEKPNFEEVPATPSLAEQTALGVLLNRPDTIEFKRYAWQDANLEQAIKQVTGDKNASHFPKGTLLWAKDDKANLYRLAYRFEIYTTEPLSRKQYYVNAHNQEIFKEIDLLITSCFEGDGHDHSSHGQLKSTANKGANFVDSPASGKANYVTTNGGIVNFTSDDNGTNFTLKATNLGPDNNQIVQTISANNQYDFDNLTDITDADNDWQDDDIAIGAHWGTEKVYEYFLNKYNRKSFDGNGAPLLSYVHYGSNYVNAFWNGVNMTYGDGDGVTWGALTSFDVIAHEIAHGVTENNGLNGLVYYSESGALNESFSDIFGVDFEFDYHPDGGDWLMGEDFDFANNSGFRSMSNPLDKGHPKTYYGTSWYTGLGDNAGVHSNSGVQNFWFYLLSTGGSGTNEYQYTYNVAGIGRDKAAAIAYRNLTTYMNRNAEFIDARDGAIQSAIDLYGDGSQEHMSTLEAWCAVGVGTTCLPEITVVNPVLNDVLTAGDDYIINWTSTMTSILPKVKIEYTVETGENATWVLIEDNVDNDGNYTWFVPSIYSTSGRIRVSDRGDATIPRPAHPLISGESRLFNVLPCSGANSFDSPATTQINVAATFTGNIPGDSFEWLINGNSVGTAQDLTYTFTGFGEFEVTYRIENAAKGCYNIESQFVYIYPDAVCDAQAIALNTPYLGGFKGATTETSEPRAPSGDCENSWCSDYLAHSLWYTFVAPASGVVGIQTEGVSYSSTKIALYEGIDCNNSNPFQNSVFLAANQFIPNQCCNGSIINKVCLTPGQTYYVQVGAEFETGDFNLTVTEKPVHNSIFESFSNCGIPADWTFNSNGKGMGVFSDAVSSACIGCGIRVFGGGDRRAAYVELPLVDFTNYSNSLLSFDYGFIPQIDGEDNELRVEIATDCGDYTTVFTRTGNDLITNDPPAHSNGDFYVPNCEEIENIEIDLSAYDGASKVSVRFIADGQWINPLVLDNILLDQPNDTCRMLDSLVLVDMYNALDGPNWTNSWDLNEPLDSFYGVTLSPFGCVTEIDLDGSIDCLPCGYTGNNLTGNLPTTFGNLFQLENLSLSRNSISGTIPTTIGNLTKLKNAHLDGLGFTGTIPTGIGNLTELNYLDLSSSDLSGSIPTSMGNLTKLTHLNLGNNQGIVGAIPTSFVNLTQLEFLYLQGNQLNTIPNLGSLSKLRTLFIADNPFNTALPTWLNSLTNLNTFYGFVNGWEGNLPDLSALINLSTLQLGSNKLTGNIPDLSSLTNLSTLYLYDNQFEGQIPVSLASNTNLSSINLSTNQLTGLIPNFSSATNLHDLEIQYNQFTFSSILPNIAAIEAVINGNSEYNWQEYSYNEQAKIGIATTYLLVVGDDYTFDLGIDADISDNNYKWYKDGAYLKDVVGSNQLLIENATAADLGIYTCEITNVGAPDLTLYSRSYALVETVPENDAICDAIDMTIGQSYTGTFLGASSQSDEPSANGNDCEEGWCNAELNGSVWYKFVAPADPYVSIETNGVGFSNTKIALYEGIDCNAVNPFANALLLKANDDKPTACCNGSIINLACLTVGEIYYVQVEQNDFNTGDFTIVTSQRATCEIPCDLTLDNTDTSTETCPNAGDGYINLAIGSTNGHRLKYELFDGADNLLRSQPYRYFYNLSAGDYKYVATSLDNVNCSIEVNITLAPKVDDTAPEVFCLTDTIDVAFVSANPLPWRNGNLLNQMTAVFGDDWHQLTYSGVNANNLFSNYYNVIYLEGSDDSMDDLATFLGANQQLVEDWVATGNTLYINTSSYHNSINLGFNGVQSSFLMSDSAFVADNTHSIFGGPNTPTTDKFGGNNAFSVHKLSKGSLAAKTLMQSEDDEILLMEADWSNGKVIFGAMNPYYWIDQQTELYNIQLNILEYLKANTIATTNPVIELALDENGMASFVTNAISVGALDDCSETTLSLNQTAFTCADTGFQFVQLIATDIYNNSALCSLEIEVVDLTGICDVEECPDERIMDDIDMSADTYRGKKIESAGSVYANKTVVFMAEESVTLKPNFHAAANSNFTAMIGACETLVNPPTVAVARNTNPILKEGPTDLIVRPNPFQSSTVIDYQLTAPQQVYLAVYSMGGQLLSVLQQGVLDAGNYTKTFQANDLNGGMYLVVLRTETELITKKVILIE